jgi:hypothetical protein
MMGKGGGGPVGRQRRGGGGAAVVWEGGNDKVVGRKGMMCGSRLSMCCCWDLKSEK